MAFKIRDVSLFQLLRKLTFFCSTIRLVSAVMSTTVLPWITLWRYFKELWDIQGDELQNTSSWVHGRIELLLERISDDVPTKAALRYLVCNTVLRNSKQLLNWRMFGFGLFPGVCNLFHRWVGTYSPVKMEQTECSGTLALKIQTPGNNPEENLRPSKHGESL
jgi:hypothetical protein